MASRRASDEKRVSWDMDARLRLIVAYVLPEPNNWKMMEAATGVTAEKWRQWERGTTRPSIAMIEAVCQKWPWYAFWLTTGLSDPYFGHVSPFSTQLGFPFATPAEHMSSNVSTGSYFRASLEALQESWGALQCVRDITDARQLAEYLADYDLHLALNNSHAEERLGAERVRVLVGELQARLKQRLEFVIADLRENFSWVDRYIDYKRESEHESKIKPVARAKKEGD